MLIRKMFIWYRFDTFNIFFHSRLELLWIPHKLYYANLINVEAAMKDMAGILGRRTLCNCVLKRFFFFNN